MLEAGPSMKSKSMLRGARWVRKDAGRGLSDRYISGNGHNGSWSLTGLCFENCPAGALSVKTEDSHFGFCGFTNCFLVVLGRAVFYLKCLAEGSGGRAC